MTSDKEVGYGRPPRHSRFQKGKSGNHKGRPGKTRNLKTDLVGELEERIRVREGPTERHLSKQQALIKSLFNKALKGDNRATALLINMMLKILDRDDSPARDLPLTENETAVLTNLRARLLEMRLPQEPNQDTEGDGEPRGLPYVDV